LRKIENRGELEGVTSAVMEMCVDNPRSGIADLFATHPSIDSRVEALVRHAGGRDPGPVVLPQMPDESAEAPDTEPGTDGPWGDRPDMGGERVDSPSSGPPSSGSTGGKPFLPSQPPVDLGSPPGPSGDQPGAPGPWGPPRRG
jgi:heat shock protein HtpX